MVAHVRSCEYVLLCLLGFMIVARRARLLPAGSSRGGLVTMGEPAAEGAPEDVEEEPAEAAAPARCAAWRLPAGAAMADGQKAALTAAGREDASERLCIPWAGRYLAPQLKAILEKAFVRSLHLNKIETICIRCG